MNKSTRRTLLIGLVVVLLATNVWWFFLRPPEPPVPAFELGSTGGVSVTISPAEAAVAPLFDPIHDRWTIGGNAVRDLAVLMRSSEAGDNQRIKFLIVQLAANANTEQARRALLTLARQHICHVALIDQGGRSQGDQPITSPVHRIVSVRDNDGKAIGCVSAV